MKIWQPSKERIAELEAKVEEQRATIDNQKTLIAILEKQLDGEIRARRDAEFTRDYYEKRKTACESTLLLLSRQLIELQADKGMEETATEQVEKYIAEGDRLCDEAEKQVLANLDTKTK